MTERLTLIYSKIPGGPGGFLPHHIRCQMCGDTGKLLAVRLDGPTLPFAFTCACYRGQGLKVNWQPWETANKRVYQRLEGVVDWEERP